MHGRMGTPYNEILSQRAQAVDLPARMHGSSGYFSRPTHDLDPRLFPRGSDELLPEVRRLLMTKLYQFWERKYHHPHWWSTAWIAGSGITHQWSGGRAIGDQPGDLDVLIGVQFSSFYKANPHWSGTPDDAMAVQFNDEFRNELWPATGNLVMPGGGAPFEVTFYVNPGAADIRSIHPYAAYNLTANEWTVHPIDLPEDWDPVTHFPKAWWDKVHGEAATATGILGEFRQQRVTLAGLEPGSGRFVNAATAMHDTVRRARELFDGIHGERHRAFGPDGDGYSDYYNFRWQASKWIGHVQALHTLAELDSDVHKDVTTACYGGPVLDAGHALALAQRAAVVAA